LNSIEGVEDFCLEIEAHLFRDGCVLVEREIPVGDAIVFQ
jgi:hypothetical protein